MNQIAEFIKKNRKAAGLTQEESAFHALFCAVDGGLKKPRQRYVIVAIFDDGISYR